MPPINNTILSQETEENQRQWNQTKWRVVQNHGTIQLLQPSYKYSLRTQVSSIYNKSSSFFFFYYLNTATNLLKTFLPSLKWIQKILLFEDSCNSPSSTYFFQECYRASFFLPWSVVQSHILFSILVLNFILDIRTTLQFHNFSWITSKSIPIFDFISTFLILSNLQHCLPYTDSARITFAFVPKCCP